MANQETNERVFTRLDRVTDPDITPEELIDIYKDWGPIYDKSVIVSQYIGYQIAAKTVMEYCPGKPSCVTVLDVGAGSGLIGKELYDMGFKFIDGVDPSKESLKVAEDKRVYRNLFCDFFTRDPLPIEKGLYVRSTAKVIYGREKLRKKEKPDTYDVIVTSGSLLNGHLPYDCLYEMVRLVKPGGIVCIVTRSSSFDNKTVPAYVDTLIPLMHDLERNGKWKKKIWETFPEYHKNEEGCKIVYEVC